MSVSRRARDDGVRDDDHKKEDMRVEQDADGGEGVAYEAGEGRGKDWEKERRGCGQYLGMYGGVNWIDWIGLGSHAWNRGQPKPDNPESAPD